MFQVAGSAAYDRAFKSHTRYVVGNSFLQQSFLLRFPVCGSVDTKSACSTSDSKSSLNFSCFHLLTLKQMYINLSLESRLLSIFLDFHDFVKLR